LIEGKFTTAEAAKKVGIHLVTLQRWIKVGKVKAPSPTLIGAVGYRLWSADDLERLRAVKQATYRKGGGRKKRSKTWNAGHAGASNTERVPNPSRLLRRQQWL